MAILFNIVIQFKKWVVDFYLTAVLVSIQLKVGVRKPSLISNFYVIEMGFGL